MEVFSYEDFVDPAFPCCGGWKLATPRFTAEAQRTLRGRRDLRRVLGPSAVKGIQALLMLNHGFGTAESRMLRANRSYFDPLIPNPNRVSSRIQTLLCRQGAVCRHSRNEEPHSEVAMDTLDLEKIFGPRSRPIPSARCRPGTSVKQDSHAWTRCAN